MKRYLVAGAVAAASLAVANAEEVTPLVGTAMEFLARASSTSEVLTLNLTNLLILLVLKALIFGFGLFSVGGGAAGRSAESPAFTQSDLNGGLNFLMYTAGEDSKLESIQRTACEDVQQARNYLTAAKMWYKMHKILGSIIPFEEKYSTIMHAVKDAVKYGETGEMCSNKYNW